MPLEPEFQEEKVRFKGEVVFHGMKIRARTKNITKINKDKIERAIETPFSSFTKNGRRF